MASGRVKKMKVHITVRHLNKGVRFGREFQACARLMKPGRGIADSGRQKSVCSITHSPRTAVGNVLESLARSLGRNKRKGHKRFGRK